MRANVERSLALALFVLLALALSFIDQLPEPAPNEMSSPFATGGTVTTLDVDGVTHYVHTFTAGGTFENTHASDLACEYLIVAGGGGGGFDQGGGGGAGGLLTSFALFSPGAYAVAVGAGGAGGTATWGGDGANSTLGALVAFGGGGGGAALDGGKDGGSGGAGGVESSEWGEGVDGQGHGGWWGVDAAGGGGGAGSWGYAAEDIGDGYYKAGDGGVGVESSITGTATLYAGGGGGGGDSDIGYTYYSPAGNATAGGGAGSDVVGVAASNGIDGTGGGGGGASRKTISESAAGGDGGDGIVIVRYADPTATTIETTEASHRLTYHLTVNATTAHAARYSLALETGHAIRYSLCVETAHALRYSLRFGTQHTTRWAIPLGLTAHRTTWGDTIHRTAQHTDRWGDCITPTRQHQAAWSATTLPKATHSALWADSALPRATHAAAWADSALPRATHAAAWADSALPRATHRTDWGAQPIATRSHRSRWSMRGGVSADHTQRWAIDAAHRTQAQHATAWALRGHTTLISTANTPTLIWRGETLELLEATLSADEGSPVWMAETLRLADRTAWSRIELGDDITLSIQCETWALRVDGKQMSRGLGDQQLDLSAVSPLAWLDQPYATPITLESDAPESAQAIVQSLLSPVSLDWALPDWLIPAGALTMTETTPLSAARTIVEAIGGVLESAPDGTAIARLRYPVSPIDYAQSAADQTWLDRDVFGVTQRMAPHDGFNRVLISSQPLENDAGRDRLEYTADELSAYRGIVRGWPEPRRPVVLGHTGHPDTEIEALGTRSRTHTELIEFVSGMASTQYRIDEIVELVWQHVDLGSVRATGTAVQAAIPEQSLARITYRSDSADWAVSLERDETVQFVLI